MPNKLFEAVIDLPDNFFLKKSKVSFTRRTSFSTSNKRYELLNLGCYVYCSDSIYKSYNIFVTFDSLKIQRDILILPDNFTCNPNGKVCHSTTTPYGQHNFMDGIRAIFYEKTECIIKQDRVKFISGRNIIKLRYWKINDNGKFYIKSTFKPKWRVMTLEEKLEWLKNRKLPPHLCWECIRE